MPNVNKPRRFPRAAIRRRLLDMLDKLAGWQRFYERKVQVVESPELRVRLYERAQVLDNVWHRINDALIVLDDPREWR